MKVVQIQTNTKLTTLIDSINNMMKLMGNMMKSMNQMVDTHSKEPGVQITTIHRCIRKLVQFLETQASTNENRAGSLQPSPKEKV